MFCFFFFGSLLISILHCVTECVCCFVFASYVVFCCHLAVFHLCHFVTIVTILCGNLAFLPVRHSVCTVQDIVVMCIDVQESANVLFHAVFTFLLSLKFCFS